MSNQAADISIAFGVDIGYVPHMAATIRSIVRNSPGCHFNFYVIHDGIPPEDQRRIESVAPEHHFEWPEITDKRMLSISTKHHLKRSAFYRIAIPDLVPQSTSRIIYLDTDLIVLRNLIELWNTDLKGHPLGAVFDPLIDGDEFARKWELSPTGRQYFNSGVLVLDLDAIRSTNGFGPALDIMTTRWDDLSYPDQCILNILFWNNWYQLDPVWNVQRCMTMEEPGHVRFTDPKNIPTGRRPKIIHYTEKNKPWSVDAYHPYTWIYYKYLRRTPYWNEVNRQAENTPLKHLRRYVKTQLNFMALRND